LDAGDVFKDGSMAATKLDDGGEVVDEFKGETQSESYRTKNLRIVFETKVPFSSSLIFYKHVVDDGGRGGVVVDQWWL